MAPSYRSRLSHGKFAVYVSKIEELVDRNKGKIQPSDLTVALSDAQLREMTVRASGPVRPLP
jgi:hypothetical protein